MTGSPASFDLAQRDLAQRDLAPLDLAPDDLAQGEQGDEPTGPEFSDLPPEVQARLEELEPALVKDLREGDREKIPEAVIEQLPDRMADQVPDSLVNDASSNPGLAIILVLIGLASLAGAVWGAVKGFLKVAVVLGIIAAAAWYWFFAR